MPYIKHHLIIDSAKFSSKKIVSNLCTFKIKAPYWFEYLTKVQERKTFHSRDCCMLFLPLLIFSYMILSLGAAVSWICTGCSYYMVHGRTNILWCRYQKGPHQINCANAWQHSFQNNNYHNNGTIDAAIGSAMIC